MPPKSKKRIQFNFSQIIALANPELEAFSNAFSYHNDTYFHKSMGSFFGIIQVLDHSEESEYIPNLLASIIKKEFYSQSTRSTEESFEVALKKANLALADLAEHDIVNWNGKLHALIGVFKKNTLYFTQVGNASIFLGRDKKLLNLSENNNATSSHPIKTFQDVVVGEIKPQDKIIITGPTIYNIFKFTDLTRLFGTFNAKEFDNLIIKTIEKEADNATVLIANIKEKVIDPAIQTIQKDDIDSEELSIDKLTKNKNFLGKDIKKTHRKKTPNKKATNKKIKKTVNKANDKSQKNTEKNSSNLNQNNKPRVTNVPLEAPASAKFPKKKSTQSIDSNDHSSFSIEKKDTSQKIYNDKITATSKTPSFPKKKASNIKNALLDKSIPVNKTKAKKIDGVKLKKQDSIKKDLSPFEQIPEIYISDEDENVEKAKKKISKKKLKQFFNTSKKNNSPAPKPIKEEIENNEITIDKKGDILSSKKNSLKNKTLNSQLQINNIWLSTQNKILSVTKQLKPISQALLIKLKNITQSFIKKISTFFKDTSSVKTTAEKIKKKIITINFKNFTFKEFINFAKTNHLIIGIIIFLILVPIIALQINKHKNTKEDTNPKPVTMVNQTPPKPVIKDLTPTKTIATLPDNIKFISGNDDLVMAYDQSGHIYEISKDNKIANINIPKNIKLNETKSITYMSNLNLFFFTSNSQVLSYSPITHKFYKNKITLPNQFDLIAQGTYLDYLYLLDKRSKQIYRYPRDTGGFGKSKTWLKTPLPNTNSLINMAVDDTIRLAYKNGKIETYFKNKLAKSTNLSVKQLDNIYTNTVLSNYYILDKKSGKILQINKETDQITKEYQNKKFTKTNNIFVNETAKKIYLFDGKNIVSINL